MTSYERESLRDMLTALDIAVNDCGWRVVLKEVTEYFEGLKEDEDEILQEVK